MKRETHLERGTPQTCLDLSLDVFSRRIAQPPGFKTRCISLIALSWSSGTMCWMTVTELMNSKELSSNCRVSMLPWWTVKPLLRQISTASQEMSIPVTFARCAAKNSSHLPLPQPRSNNALSATERPRLLKHLLKANLWIRSKNRLNEVDLSGKQTAARSDPAWPWSDLQYVKASADVSFFMSKTKAARGPLASRLLRYLPGVGRIATFETPGLGLRSMHAE